MKIIYFVSLWICDPLIIVLLCCVMKRMARLSHCWNEILANIQYVQTAEYQLMYNYFAIQLQTLNFNRYSHCHLMQTL